MDQILKTEVHIKLNAFINLYRDPDSVVLCVLATDEEDENDVALQIHFTLIQAFCCDIDINIVRVSGMRRLAQVLEEPLSTDSNANEPRDLHCILVTVSIIMHITNTRSVTFGRGVQFVHIAFVVANYLTNFLNTTKAFFVVCKDKYL